MHDLDHQVSILVTDADLERLQAVVDQGGESADELDAELHRAVIVPQDDVPSDVITMESEVVYEDVATGGRRTVRLVYPRYADAIGYGRLATDRDLVAPDPVDAPFVT